MFDYDEIDDWAPKLAAALKDHVSDAVRNKIAAMTFEFVEDARDTLFKLVDRDAVIDATIAWIRSSALAGYHGTRLTDAEVDSVRAIGLVPLNAEMRRGRLERAFALHPRWSEMAEKLDELIYSHGPGERAGPRENQVHLTLSRSGVNSSFNHYLKSGSEFDQRVAVAILGSEGIDLLGRDGSPKLIKCAVPGGTALDASHQFFSIDDLRSKGDVPNLVDQFLNAWSYKLAYPEFQSGTLKTDCGMVFRETVPASWIVDVDTFSDDF